MRSFLGLFVIIILSLTGLVSCGVSAVEDGTDAELYNKGNSFIANGNYSRATRYLQATISRYPASAYSEQAELALIFAAYKAAEYKDALVAAERFLRAYPTNKNVDYVLYLAGLINSELGDNAVQNFVGVDRAGTNTSPVKNAFQTFQLLVTNFPDSVYTPDAVIRMAYLKSRLARHELEIAKFYLSRNAHVAAANRVAGMLRDYPDTKATWQALPIMKEAYAELGLTDLEKEVDAIIKANQGKNFDDVEKKPVDPKLAMPQA